MRSNIRILWLLLLLAPSLHGKKIFQPFSAESFYNPPEPGTVKPVCISHAGANPQVQRFNKLELGFNLPATLSAQVEAYFRNGKGLNPFDPEQLNVEVTFTNGTASAVAAFYYSAYKRDSSTIEAVFDNAAVAKWKPLHTGYKWRVRFAPPREGKWSAVIRVYAPGLSQLPYVYETFEFTAEVNGGDGFLSLAKDKRHFVLDGSKKSFFCLGQDIAWPDGVRFRGAAHSVYSNLILGGFIDVQEWTKSLAESGGNMIRVVNVPESYELEWDTVGRYRMDRAWELDSLFSVCEANNVKMIFCMEHGTYTIPAGHEGFLDWNKHPYHRFIKGIAMPEDFLSDSIARKKYRNKLRYFLARWGYSESLGIFQLVSEMEHWTLRGPNTNLKDNKSAQRKFLTWHNEMLQFAKEQVTYRPLLTSTSYGAAPRDYAINAFSSEFVDVVCPKHCYYTQRNDNVDRFNEINNSGLFEKGIHGLFPDKPAIIDETGFGTNVADPNDIDACNDVTYHNTLWSTSFMGTAGAGLYWWRWGSNEYRANNFPALAAFFADVDFVNYNMVLPSHWEDASRAANVSIETFYTLSDDRARSRCIGWVHNASYWWGNVSQACKDRNGKSTAINTKTRDDAKLAEPRELPAGTKFEVHDLAARATYSITWYSTREAGKSWSGGEVKTNMLGVATLEWISGAGDYGFRLERVLQ